MRVIMNVKNICVWPASSTAMPAGAKVPVSAPPEMKTRPDPSFFQIPEGYRTVSLEQRMVEQSEKDMKRKQHKLQHRAAPCVAVDASRRNGSSLRHRPNGKAVNSEAGL
jgi:hypothetical protein